MEPKNVIRFILVMLPAALLLLGTASMIYYFRAGLGREDDYQTGSLMQKPISKADLVNYVTVLTEDIGERNLEDPRRLEIAAKYLESSLGINNMGYIARRQTYRVGDVNCANIEVELPGNGSAGEIVVVGAHYDSVPGTVGANDNGSGVAALLCLANALAGSENARTLRFVAFVNEEMPHFQTGAMGSMQYAKRCRKEGENVVAMLCLETLGYYDDAPGSQNYPEPLGAQYPDTGNFIAFVSNLDSRPLLEEVTSAFARGSDFPFERGAFPPEIPGVAWSDHWAFWQAGYPGVMVTDTAPFRYPHYHLPTDTVEKLDFDRLYAVVTGLEFVIRELANPGK